ncbi:hypothetical protein RIF29_24361 [Crotalaria pallida]|uniref:Uncharacterized protein n=1 Tax=Crotalaria pallida TaxID=3830 RepID=A0AAN9I363_CROPI
MGLIYQKWTSGSMVMMGKVESTQREDATFNLSCKFEQYVHYALDVLMICAILSFNIGAAKLNLVDALLCRTLWQVGLLYDEVSLHNVLDMIAEWTPKDLEE